MPKLGAILQLVSASLRVKMGTFQLIKQFQSQFNFEEELPEFFFSFLDKTYGYTSNNETGINEIRVAQRLTFPTPTPFDPGVDSRLGHL